MNRLLIIGFTLILATGCVKENSNEFFPYSNNQLNDTNWYAVPAPNAPVRELNEVFDRHVVTDSVNGSNGGTVMLGDSIMMHFPGGFAQVTPGTIITGKILIEVTQLAKKGDMIRHNIPTMSYDRLLVTGGSLFIRATYNGQEVHMTPGIYVTVRTINKFTATPSQNMKLFYGNESANVTPVQPFTWVPWIDSSNAIAVVTTQVGGGTTMGYQFSIDRFRWVNVDYFADSSQATKITAVMPLNFTNANTNVYAVFKNDNIVAQLRPDPVNKLFYLNNAILGKEVTIVTVSKINDKLYLGTKDITVAPNMNNSLQPTEVTKQQIEDYLNAL